MQKFVDDMHYVSYIQRSWQSGDRIIIDYGSHRNFFEIEGITYDEYINNLQKND
jgi:hypothetical protein